VVIAVIGVWLAWKFLSDRPVSYASAEEHFKYGSIGSEVGGSLSTPVGGILPPEWIFRVLPQIAPEKLPGGYASLGLVFEKGHGLPIGVSQRKRLGFEQVGLNCAICHVGTYRATPTSEPVIVLGMPAHSLELQRFFDFVTQATLDPRFTPDNVIAKIQESGGDLGPVDRYLLRSRVIPLTRETTLNLRNRLLFFLIRMPANGVRAESTRSIRTRQFSSTGSWQSFRIPS